LGHVRGLYVRHQPRQDSSASAAIWAENEEVVNLRHFERRAEKVMDQRDAMNKVLSWLPTSEHLFRIVLSAMDAVADPNTPLLALSSCLWNSSPRPRCTPDSVLPLKPQIRVFVSA
jgi:hypothetical protein